MQFLDGGDGASLASTLPHAQTKMQLHSKFKKSSSEPLMAHQATLAMRYTPHPNKVVSGTRWPTPGWKYGGMIDPKDNRRHAYDFGCRQLRFPDKKSNCPSTKEEVAEMTLDELRNYLTKSYGSLKKAFDKMDFFGDGQLSAIEWREGMYNTLFNSFGTDGHKGRMAIVPRQQFNTRMQHLFSLIDENEDGLISFDELSRPYLEPEESSHAHTRRRIVERAAHTEEKTALLNRSLLTGSFASRAPGPPAHHREKVDPDSVQTPLRDFAVYIVKHFKDVNAAFTAFDVLGHGQLNLAEFVEGARRHDFPGNAEDIFKYLDERDTGTIGKKDLKKLRQLPPPRPPAYLGFGTQRTMQLSQTLSSLGTTKKDMTMSRQFRSDIQQPPNHTCGLTLTSTDIRRPLGEGMRSASGFYTIPRSATGRMDDLLHPNQLPGQDVEQFSAEHGPGSTEHGPEFYPYLGLAEHPRRGDKWKMGATINREQRFGVTMPSRQGQSDRDLSGMSYATYEGRRPFDGFRISNTGGISWGKSPVRPGITIR